MDQKIREWTEHGNQHQELEPSASAINEGEEAAEGEHGLPTRGKRSRMEIQRELLLDKPVDLADAMSKAQLFEDRNDELVGRSKSEGSRLGWYPHPSTYLPPTHGNETLEVLIDTSNNNNFIQETLANRLGLKCEDTKCFKVYMGNGNSILCSKICCGVDLWPHGHQFNVDLYVLTIWGLDIVLGMQWLQTLGPCLHDHEALRMEFQWQGKAVKLASSADSGVHQLTFHQFRSLLNEGEELEPSASAVNKGEEAAECEHEVPARGKRSRV
ncbi:hypothetical protein G4B88_022040 [Cannabis sativa]|uniref:Retrotransposon protein n=1 Tax=Cannabis sativa TaxID=3483 RepID=A0A7J6FU44_CANSA|nr:hypothetical protein G4B88_022040 [Cannabis sativa]